MEITKTIRLNDDERTTFKNASEIMRELSDALVDEDVTIGGFDPVDIQNMAEFLEVISNQTKINI